MHDLLYLSENKMRALVPQLPGQLRRRLGFEAGLNVGVASAKASLPGESSQPSSVALLDAVVEMIEQAKGGRERTDSDLRAGDWIHLKEEFRYGDAATAAYVPRGQTVGHALSGLVYFAATAGAPLVLLGSSVHVLDRWQPGNSTYGGVGASYLDAVIAYARQLAQLPDEAAITEFTPPPQRELYPDLSRGLYHLCKLEARVDRRSRWVTGPVRLTGHARVLAVVGGNSASRRINMAPWVLATPLYMEYAPRG